MATYFKRISIKQTKLNALLKRRRCAKVYPLKLVEQPWNQSNFRKSRLLAFYSVILSRIEFSVRSCKTFRFATIEARYWFTTLYSQFINPTELNLEHGKFSQYVIEYPVYIYVATSAFILLLKLNNFASSPTRVYVS